jgi:hypothetical protein
MDLLIRLPLAAAMLGSCLWLAYLVAIPMTAHAGEAAEAGPAERAAAPHARLAAAALTALWLQVVVFTALAAVQRFQLVVAAPLWLGGAAIAHRLLGGRQAAALLASDLAAARSALVPPVRTPLRAPLLLAGAALLGTRLVRDLVSPPLAWDAFLYHLYKPAGWVQHGGFVDAPAPDAWGYLDYFPHAGDIPWAWAMLATRDDTLIAPAGVLVWSSCVLGAYALARAFGARGAPAGLCALAVGFVPAVANTSTSSYADNFVLAAFLLGAVFAVELARRPSVGRAALAGAGFGLVAGGKLSGLPALGLGVAFVVVLLARSSLSWRARVRARAAGIAATVAAALASALPGYLRAYLATGSPFYPLTVKLGDTTLFAGNQELALLCSGKILNLSSYDDSIPSLLRALFIPARQPLHEHIGFGIGSIPLVVLGAAGAVQILRRRETRAVALFLAVVVTVPACALLSDNFVAHRTIWQQVIGRLFTPLPALLAAFGARNEGRLAHVLWGLVLLSNLVSCTPMGFSAPAGEGLSRLAPALLAAAGAAAVVYSQLGRRTRRPLLGAAAGALVSCLVVAAPLAHIRGELRYPIFATHADRNPSFQMHALEPTYASSWTMWQYFDSGPPHRIAVVPGWDGKGNNAYRYPLMGSRLQNAILYVPPSKDGSIIDYREGYRIYQNADFDTWVARLVERQIEYVVTLHPTPIEEYWMEVHYELFEPVAASSEGYNVAYRFLRERAAPRR